MAFLVDTILFTTSAVEAVGEMETVVYPDSTFNSRISHLDFTLSRTVSKRIRNHRDYNVHRAGNNWQGWVVPVLTR